VEAYRKGRGKGNMYPSHILRKGRGKGEAKGKGSPSKGGSPNTMRPREPSSKSAAEVQDFVAAATTAIASCVATLARGEVEIWSTRDVYGGSLFEIAALMLADGADAGTWSDRSRIFSYRCFGH